MKKGRDNWKELAAVVMIIGLALGGSYLFLSCADEYAEKQAASPRYVAARFAGGSAR